MVALTFWNLESEEDTAQHRMKLETARMTPTCPLVTAHHNLYSHLDFTSTYLNAMGIRLL